MRPLMISTGRADWAALSEVRQSFIKAGIRLETIITGTNPVRESDRPPDAHFISTRPGDPDLISFPLGQAAGSADDLMAKINHIDPDIAVLVGDRYETVLAALACLALRVPIAHLSGGDVTRGSMDDRYRDAITKMAHLHFPTTKMAGGRLTNVLGVAPARVVVTGSPAADAVVSMSKPGPASLLSSLRLPEDKPFALVNWQQETNGSDDGLDAIFSALAGRDISIIQVDTSPEESGLGILPRHTDAFAGRLHIGPLSLVDYVTAMKGCWLMLGNSSSAFFEASALAVRAVDVGHRQDGRTAPNVIRAEATRGAVLHAIKEAEECGLAGGICPFRPYPGEAADRIRDAIMAVPDFPTLLKDAHV